MQSDVVTFLGMVMDRRTRWNFLCEAINAGLMGLFVGVVGPFALPMAIRLGADSLQVGLIVSGPFLANLLSPYWARLSEPHRKLPWVIYPHLIWRGGLGFLGLLKNPAAMTALILGTNMAVAAAHPPYGALCQKIYPAPIRGRLMGYVRLLLAAVMLPSTLAAGILIDRYDPAWLFLAAGAMGLVALGVYSRTREPYDAMETARFASGSSVLQGFRAAFGDTGFRRFLMAASLFHGGALMGLPLYSVYQIKVMNLTNSQIGYLAIFWNLAFLAAFAVWGRLIDRRGAAFVVTMSAVLYLGLPLSYALGGGLFAVIALGALFQGAADAAMDLGGWNIILSANPERVGVYTSTHMTMLGIRGALGPMLGTWLMKMLGFTPTFLISAALVTAGLGLFLTRRRSPAITS